MSENKEEQVIEDKKEEPAKKEEKQDTESKAEQVTAEKEEAPQVKEEKAPEKKEAKKELTEGQQQAELHRLQKLTVTKLREEAMSKFHDQLKGVHGMRKGELLAAMCKLMGISLEEEHHVSKLKKVTLEELRVRMIKLKAQREEALKSKDHKQLEQVRKKIKKIKRTLRRVA